MELRVTSLPSSQFTVGLLQSICTKLLYISAGSGDFQTGLGCPSGGKSCKAVTQAGCPLPLKCHLSHSSSASTSQLTEAAFQAASELTETQVLLVILDYRHQRRKSTVDWAPRAFPIGCFYRLSKRRE